MESYYTADSLTVDSNNIRGIMDNAYTAMSNYQGYKISGTGAINNNQNNNMKETSRDLYKLTFLKTTVTEHVYEVLAESLEEAKKAVENGAFSGDTKTISIDIELYSTEDSDGNEITE